MNSRSHYEPAEPSARINSLSAELGRDGELLAAGMVRREGRSPEGR